LDNFLQFTLLAALIGNIYVSWKVAPIGNIYGQELKVATIGNIYES